MMPVRVHPLVRDLGRTAGHRLVLLSLEVYDTIADLRFARIDDGASQPLARRVPPTSSWTITVDGVDVDLLDAVGRGDRSFSNGEVRFAPPPPPDATMQVRVRLAPGADPLEATLTLPRAATPPSRR